MRLKSLLAVLLLAIAGLGTVGCGSSSNDDFVIGGDTVGPPRTGNLTFNFVTAQGAFEVDAGTARLRFDFFNGVDQTPVLTVTRDFANSITIENVPTSATSVLITGFNANRIPLFTISQSIAVSPGETAVVDGLSNAVPVTLSQLRLAPGSLFEADGELTQVVVPVGGATQVFLFGEYSNGSIVLLGDLATYSVGSNIATVNTTGLVSGVSAGTSTFIAQFAGLTKSVPLLVNDGTSIDLDSITVQNQAPIQVSTATPVQLIVSGTGSTGTFALPSNRLTYSVDPSVGWSVSTSGVVSVQESVVAGSTAVVTITWTNPDSSIVNTNATVTKI